MTANTITATAPVLEMRPKRAITEQRTVEFVTYTPQRFMGLTLDTGRLVSIIGLTTNGNWLSRDMHIYRPENITADLAEFARQQIEAAHDQHDTQHDALR